MGQINEEKLLGQWHLLKERYFTDLSGLPSDCFFYKIERFKNTIR